MKIIILSRKVFVITLLFLNIATINCMNQIPAERTGSLADALLQLKPYQSKHATEFTGSLADALSQFQPYQGKRASSTDISYQAPAAKKPRISPIDPTIQMTTTPNQDQFLLIHPFSTIIAAELFPNIQLDLDEQLNDNNDYHLFDSGCVSSPTNTQSSFSTAQQPCTNKKINYSTLAEYNDIFFCAKCGKSFLTKYDLTTHKRIHYRCPIQECTKKFSRSSNLKQHMRTHTGEKPYTCDVCNKKFSCSSYLKQHKRIHTGEKPYTCDVCNKKFNQQTHLKEHMRIHTGEKPYACTFPGCTKKCSQSSSLKMHMKIHINKEDLNFI